MKIKELLADPKKWTKGAFARGAEREPVGSNSTAAECWCLAGALHFCYPYNNGVTALRLAEAVSCQPEDGINCVIAKWNDAPDRTHAEVLELVTRLDV